MCGMEVRQINQGVYVLKENSKLQHMSQYCLNNEMPYKRSNDENWTASLALEQTAQNLNYMTEIN